jgi:hypothetical protein
MATTPSDITEILITELVHDNGCDRQEVSADLERRLLAAVRAVCDAYGTDWANPSTLSDIATGEESDARAICQLLGEEGKALHETLDLVFQGLLDYGTE